jgi:hypothetical protein
MMKYELVIVKVVFTQLSGVHHQVVSFSWKPLEVHGRHAMIICAGLPCGVLTEWALSLPFPRVGISGHRQNSTRERMSQRQKAE